jgi:hypothetical protein
VLCIQYYKGGQIKDDEMDEACSAHMGMTNACKILFGKPEGRRPAGRSGHRWKDNIEMGLREMEFEVMDWIYLVEDRNR